MTDKQRMDFLATCEGGFPAVTRIGQHDIYGPMMDALDKPDDRVMQRAFRDLVDRAMEDEKKPAGKGKRP